METVLGRPTVDTEVASFSQYVNESALDEQQMLHAIQSTAEFVHRELTGAKELHLFAIHRARVQLMATVLPSANRILDLGGANAPLCDAGYPHRFQEMVVVDLPPEDRHDAFAGRIVHDRDSASGPVRVAYTSMTDLAMFESASFDLVWSGQSVEHISVEAARQMFAEVLRVLRPGGWFCLDTPNRLLTTIHAEGAMIHPDHKHEYSPAELMRELEAAGFRIEQSLGVCDMPFTSESGVIDYRDFLVGAGIIRSLDTAYIQYHACRPAYDGEAELPRHAGRRVGWLRERRQR